MSVFKKKRKEIKKIGKRKKKRKGVSKKKKGPEFSTKKT